MKRKVAIVVGTRPNFIKITQFERVFKTYGDRFEYMLIHTGQHYDKNMSDVFFEQLKLKSPDVTLNVKNLSPAKQIGLIITALADLFESDRPDLVVVVGDVNSTLAAAIAAKKSKILFAHLESGLRSFDVEMPEEINRMLTDLICDAYFVTEQSGYDNLVREGADKKKLHFVGNTMIDTLVAFDDEIQQSDVMERLKIEKSGFALMTMHRPRNVDTAPSLLKLLDIIDHITAKRILVFPIHPRTTKSLTNHGLIDRLTNNDRVIITEPLDYLAFQNLIANAKYVITDSGGIQEETTFRRVPCLTLRNNTERPSTTEIGSNTLLPYDARVVAVHVDKIENGTYKRGVVPKLWDGGSTERIVQVMDKMLG